MSNDKKRRARKLSLRSLISAIALFAVLASLTTQQATGQDDANQAARNRMVEQYVKSAGVKDARVLQSIRTTPRHEFVPTRLRRHAHFDMALPIGYEQTISSPFIVAFMTESLAPKKTDKVLEIGTGSGYQAAVLSPLVEHVYSIEIVEALGKRAKRTLQRLGYANVTTKVGDGFKGWKEHAPFDKIVVTCSPENVPQPLVDQLSADGLMIIPVGERYQQTLYLFRKIDGKLKVVDSRPTLFVPMTGRAEDNRVLKPDPAKPKLVNGDFSKLPKSGGFTPGWYYQRNAEVTKEGSEKGRGHHILFTNDLRGQSAHILQGFAIDGTKIAELQVKARVKTAMIRPGRNADEQPYIALSFYDKNRRDLGLVTIGPLTGDRKWYSISKQIRVPAQTAEGLFRVGLFGATGELRVDDIRMTYTRR